MFYGPDGTLLRYYRLVTGTFSASSENQEHIQRMADGLKGVQQIKDHVVVHGTGTEQDKRLKALFERFPQFNIILRKEKCQLGISPGQLGWQCLLQARHVSKPNKSRDDTKLATTKRESRNFKP